MPLPKITIITPSYNQGQFIEQTILSVIEQNYPNLEYIIIDGGSTDNTIEIIKKYEKQIAYWISEPDNGQTEAINKGLKIATGDIFNWLNSDDYLEKDALNSIAKIFNENPNTNIVCGYTHCFYNSSGQTSHTYRMGLKQSATKTILNIEMNQPATFYKLDIVKQLGGVNNSLHFAFDDELWIRYICKYGIENIFLSNNLFAHFRLHDCSKSVASDWQKFTDERNSVFLHIAQNLNFPDFIIQSIKKQIQNLYYISNNFNNFDFLDKKEFLAYFCNKFMFCYYKNYMYKELEYAYNAQKKYYPMNNKSLKLYIKTFVMPRKILNWLRK